MSASPLARQSRKSLSAFARPPSHLSKSHSTRDLVDEPKGTSSPPSTSSSSSSSSSQNAFATPVREREDRPRYRSSAVGVGGSPRTPTTHITYSPYATPPAPLSKSSSIPFDMAANARAAKQYEEDRARAARRASLNPVPEGGSSSKKKRFVRKKSLWTRIIESPGNLVDSALLQFPSTVEDILPPARFANPLALALYIIHWLLLAPLRAAPDDADSVIRTGHRVDDRWGRYEEPKTTARIGVAGARTAFLVTVLLFALASTNTVYLFTRFRTYDLLTRTAQDVVSSPHASPAPSPTARRNNSTASDDARLNGESGSPSPPPGGTGTSPAEKYARLALRCLWTVTKYLAASLLSALGARPPRTSASSSSTDSIQTLRVWEPPEFCLAFFCAFPPAAPLVGYLLTTPHPFLTPLVHAATVFFLSHLAANYAQLVKDRMLLSAEVMREYDRRFVYRKIFASKVDRGVGTSDP